MRGFVIRCIYVRVSCGWCLGLGNGVQFSVRYPQPGFLRGGEGGGEKDVRSGSGHCRFGWAGPVHKDNPLYCRKGCGRQGCVVTVAVDICRGLWESGTPCN